MKKKTIILLTLATVCLVAAFAPTCSAITTNGAKACCLTDEDGNVLDGTNVETKRPIASMTKIMTLCCVYDEIESGKLSLTDSVSVSENASSMGGSQVFLDSGSSYSVEQLLKSVIICSANDSCVALAEHVSGSVEAFVDKMNAKADSYKMQNTHFSNCTGLPAVDAFSTAKDVCLMMSHLIKNKHYFKCASVWMEDFVHNSGRVTGMTNTNKLVRFFNGCDGGKTGFTSEAMHCLCATAKRGETRLISCVIAAPDSKTRFKTVTDMLNYGFATYENKVYLADKQNVDSVAVKNSKEGKVEIVSGQKLCCFGKRGECVCEKSVEIFDVAAPIAKGDVVGRAVLKRDGVTVAECDLLASTVATPKTFWDYVGDVIDKW